jgi:hypothetical protein
MPMCGACVAGANGGTIMATIIRRAGKHEQLSFRAQVRRLAPSSESSMGIYGNAHIFFEKIVPTTLNLELDHYRLSWG